MQTALFGGLFSVYVVGGTCKILQEKCHSTAYTFQANIHIQWVMPICYFHHIHKSNREIAPRSRTAAGGRVSGGWIDLVAVLWYDFQWNRTVLTMCCLAVGGTPSFRGVPPTTKPTASTGFFTRITNMKFFAWNCEKHQWLEITDIGVLREIPEGRGDIVSVRRYSEPDKVLEAAKLTWLRLFGQYEQRIYRLVELCGTAQREDIVASVAAGDSRNVYTVTRSLNGLLDKRALIESHGGITCNPIVPLTTVTAPQKAAVKIKSPYRAAAEWILTQPYHDDPQCARYLVEDVLHYESNTRQYAGDQGTIDAFWPLEKRPPLIPPPPTRKGKRDRRKELIMREVKALLADG